MIGTGVGDGLGDGAGVGAGESAGSPGDALVGGVLLGSPGFSPGPPAGVLLDGVSGTLALGAGETAAGVARGSGVGNVDPGAGGVGGGPSGVGDAGGGEATWARAPIASANTNARLPNVA
jgi:hypothetical protein